MVRTDRTVRIDLPDYELLRKLAKRYDLPNNEVIGLLLELCEEHNLLRKDWQKSINALVERGRKAVELNEWEGMEDAPQGIRYAKETFVFVEITKDGKLKVKPLSPVWREALAIVREFERQKAERQEKELHDKLLIVKEEKMAELAIGEIQTIKIQKCNAGATLAGRGKNFRFCRHYHTPNKEVSIKTYCKVKLNGGPCESLAFEELPYDAYEIVEQQLKKKGKKRTNNR